MTEKFIGGLKGCCATRCAIAPPVAQHMKGFVGIWAAHLGLLIFGSPGAPCILGIWAAHLGLLIFGHLGGSMVLAHLGLLVFWTPDFWAPGAPCILGIWAAHLESWLVLVGTSGMLSCIFLWLLLSSRRIVSPTFGCGGWQSRCLCLLTIRPDQ
jgi:hypothetical protein